MAQGGSDPTELYSGQGIVSYSERNELGRPTGGFIDLGNCSKLETKATVERVEHTESRTGSNFTDAVFEKSQKVEFNGTFDSFSAENLNLYLYGSTIKTASATVTDEEVIGIYGRKAALSKMVTTFTSLTNAAGSTTYVEGTDYTIDPRTGMLTFPSAGAAFADGDSLRANYTSAAERSTAAFTQLNTYKYLRFDGLNRASDGKPVVIEVYKGRFDPSEMLDIINEEFAEYVLNGMALYDNCHADDSAYGGFMRVRVKDE